MAIGLHSRIPVKPQGQPEELLPPKSGKTENSVKQPSFTNTATSALSVSDYFTGPRIQ